MSLHAIRGEDKAPFLNEELLDPILQKMEKLKQLMAREKVDTYILQYQNKIKLVLISTHKMKEQEKLVQNKENLAIVVLV